MKNVVILTFFFVCSVFAGQGVFHTVNGAKNLALNGMNYAGNNDLNSVNINPAGLAMLSGSAFQISFNDQMGNHVYQDNNNNKYRAYDDDILSLDGGFFASYDNWIFALQYTRIINYDVDWPYTQLFNKPGNSVVLAFDMHQKVKADA